MFSVALSVLEQGQQGNGKVELAFDIEVEHLVPALLFGKINHRRAPSETRVVDEDIEPSLDLLDLVGERIAASLAADVGLQRHAEPLLALGIAWGQLAQLHGHFFEIGEFSTGNVHLGAVANVGGGDHLADTGATSGDKGNLAIEREEALSTELGHDFGGSVLGHFDGV